MKLWGPVTLATKKTGDYSVLSAADLSILAITSALHDEAAAKAGKNEHGQQELSEVCFPAIPRYQVVTGVLIGRRSPL